MSSEFAFPVLAIDYGIKRVGLALAETPLAEPLSVLENTSEAELLEQLKTVFDQHQVRTIVVGVSEGAMAERTHQFVATLRSVTSVPILTWDETLTTHQAHSKLRQRGSAGPHRPVVDHLAAAELLQDFLDS